MNDLFAVGRNDEGYFVYPVNKPPYSPLTPSGDEITFQQACHLCGSLNHSVEAYIEGIAQSNPMDLLRSIAKTWNWRKILYYIARLIREDTEAKKEESYTVLLRRNMDDLEYLVRHWL